MMLQAYTKLKNPLRQSLKIIFGPLTLLTQVEKLVGDFPKTKVCSRFIPINFKTYDDKIINLAQISIKNIHFLY